MNVLELKIIDLLKDMKKNYGVVELKAEFESEAARMNELMRLKEIVEKVGLGLIIKIGGCEAISNMFDAQHIGVTGLIAPMVESAYSMKKYLEAINKYFSKDVRMNIHFGVNIETYLGYQNINEILSQENIDLIDTLTLGRVDMTGSLGLGRDDINHDNIYRIAESMFTLARMKNLRTTVGGGIAVEAIPFIKKLSSKKLLDRYETRKVVFTVPESFSKAEKGIIMANKFELLWLENKRNYYSSISHEDDSRIEMLKKRIK
jgi:hypothetical protein